MSASPVAIHPTATPREFARLLLDNGISGVPVVDGAGRVIGVASKTDLLQWCVKGGLGFGAGDLLVSLADGGQGTRIDAIDLGIVADFMTPSPVTIAASACIPEAVRLMAHHRIQRLIVVGDDGRLVGVITSLDLLKTSRC